MKNTKLEVCKKCWGKGRVHGGDENSTWSKTCEDCHGIGFVRVPKTNADRIRAMTDEELAKWLLLFVRSCGAVNGNNIEWADGMEEKMLDMLQQPAEGE